jgi:hypothetical protein
MRNGQDTAIEALMEQLVANGSKDMGVVFASLFDLTMRIERERFLGAERYERTPGRRGYANGTKPKRLDTPAGSLTVNVPKTAGHDEPFYPQSLERGRRSIRAVLLAVAEMYIKGISTRSAEAVMKHFGIESLSSSQASRAASLLDDDLDAWQTRPLGGVVRDAAVLSAMGVGPDGRRRVLGVSCALSEAEVHWRAFLESLLERGMAVSNSWSPMTMPACARRARRCSPPSRGNIASFIWRGTLSSRRSSAARSKCGSSQTKHHSNVWSVPSQSKSAKKGPSPIRPTSNGSARMTDQRKSESPDFLLHNPLSTP